MLTLILLLCLVSRSSDRVRTVDIIELNSFYNAQGNLIFDQWIFWRWNKNPTYGWRYDILDWKLAKDIRFEFSEEELKIETKRFHEEWAKTHKFTPPPKLDPEIDWSKIYLSNNGRYNLILFDGKKKQLILVCSKLFRQTYTVYDKEVYEREFLPEKQRIGLLSH